MMATRQGLVTPSLDNSEPGKLVRLFNHALERQRLRAVFQPIVEIESTETVAFEALIRGPGGSAVESPGALFGAAKRAGRLAELEWACRTAALKGALDADVGAQVTLFVNTEPSVLGAVIPSELAALSRQAKHKLRLMLELTERDLTRRPADLLALVAWARENWWGVALDDVGAEPESLALLPFVQPDVIKLDMRLIQSDLTAEDERVVDVVRQHANRTGATILAEGIETEQQVAKAVELGATLGQGWFYGRPGPLEGRIATRSRVKLLPPPERIDAASVFEYLAEETEPRRATATELLELSAGIEAQAATGEPPAVLLASFGTAERYAGRAERYEALAEHAPLVGVLGVGLDKVANGRLRCTPLSDREPLTREWVVIAVSPWHCEVVAARSLGSDPAGLADQVELVHTHDRDEVLAVAEMLMRRVVPASR